MTSRDHDRNWIHAIKVHNVQVTTYRRYLRLANPGNSTRSYRSSSYNRALRLTLPSRFVFDQPTVSSSDRHTVKLRIIPPLAYNPPSSLVYSSLPIQSMFTLNQPRPPKYLSNLHSLLNLSRLAVPASRRTLLTKYLPKNLKRCPSNSASNTLLALPHFSKIVIGSVTFPVVSYFIHAIGVRWLVGLVATSLRVLHAHSAFKHQLQHATQNILVDCK